MLATCRLQARPRLTLGLCSKQTPRGLRSGGNPFFKVMERVCVPLSLCMCGQMGAFAEQQVSGFVSEANTCTRASAFVLPNFLGAAA